MAGIKNLPDKKNIMHFQRDSCAQKNQFTFLGKGELGGKANGLAKIRSQLELSPEEDPSAEIEFGIPSLTVISTSCFKQFMEMNHLYDVVKLNPDDEKLAHYFQRAELPPDVIGDLRALIVEIHTPLAIRSSSLLEDSLESPFAGIYQTKMIPNNQPDTSIRFLRLAEAIKFIYASTFFKTARDYMKSSKNNLESEKMAVIVQEIAGHRYTNRFYPNLSGVARSYNFYPSGEAKSEDGIVNLALGLGKTIVDGGISWSYSPPYPEISPPFNSIDDVLDKTQREFWSVNMGKPPAYDPIQETEYLTKSNIMDAEYDNTLKYVASTYDVQSDRINPGTSSNGPRIINFAPLLQLEQFPINSLIRNVLHRCESIFNTPVEIEFAMTFPSATSKTSYFGLLQVRPIHISQEIITIDPEEMQGNKCLVSSANVLGNGIQSSIQDIVYLSPEKFDFQYSTAIAQDLEKINRSLLKNERPFVLVVYGRLGSSDPWLGIPVEWGQISGAKVIIEAKLSSIRVDLSQGSHLFHNISNLKVFYFSLDPVETTSFDWEWLKKQKIVQETEFVKHIRLSSPLTIKVDGRRKTGVILK